MVTDTEETMEDDEGIPLHSETDREEEGPCPGETGARRSP